jgi:hypothetical protein
VFGLPRHSDRSEIGPAVRPLEPCGLRGSQVAPQYRTQDPDRPRAINGRSSTTAPGAGCTGAGRPSWSADVEVRRIGSCQGMRSTSGEPQNPAAVDTTGRPGATRAAPLRSQTAWVIGPDIARGRRGPGDALAVDAFSRTIPGWRRTPHYPPTCLDALEPAVRRCRAS